MDETIPESVVQRWSKLPPQRRRELREHWLDSRHRQSLGFKFNQGRDGYEDVTCRMPAEAARNLRRWLELYGVEPTAAAQSLLVEAVVWQLSNGSIDEPTRFHFGEFTEGTPNIELPEGYWQRTLRRPGAPPDPDKDPVVAATDRLFANRHHLPPDILRSLEGLLFCASAARYGQPYERFWEHGGWSDEAFTAHHTACCEAENDGDGKICDECQARTKAWQRKMEQYEARKAAAAGSDEPPF
jgi:hypothetical protein